MSMRVLIGAPEKKTKAIDFNAHHRAAMLHCSLTFYYMKKDETANS
jgi:hypothetical protein